ncbi:MAG TPA: glycosyltransferase family 4 protein [Terriglobales bacterium]|nr:glycosyltransferase family 4 protein [Terriglobales bacterium]
MTGSTEWVGPFVFDGAGQQRSVIIVGPPWPRSGTARVIQNQICHYRERGFVTVFVAVPFGWHFIHISKNLKEMIEGLNELGADRVCMATLEQRRYNAAKYKASVRHAFHGTVLDWRVAIGEAARLSDGDVEFLKRLRPTLFHVNHVYTQGFALNLRRRFYNDGVLPPIILETHDIQSQFLEEKGERNPWTRRPDRFERLIKSETRLLEKANVLIHLSVDDFKLFQAAIPSKPQFLVFPTIDEKFASTVRAALPTTGTIDLLFLGHSNPANLAAVKWFLNEVLPLLADQRCNLKIVGPIGSMVQWELPQLYDKFRSCFVGEVADLIAYYRAARCVIAPMVSGSGISIKTIEALALGKPFVGTTKAFRGMPMDRLKEIGIQAHDEPQAFANAITDALRNEPAAQALSRAAYEKVFSIEASAAGRDEALRVALASRPAKPLLRRLGSL